MSFILKSFGVSKTCECGCGGFASVGRRFILGHNMISEDLSGLVFGKLTVVGSKRVPKKSGKKFLWTCVCHCGKEVNTSTSKLTSGVSSGCASCNNGYKKRPYESQYNVLVTSCKRRGYTSSITYEEYGEFSNFKTCHYCDCPVLWVANGDQQHGHKLDRKDNSVGYTKDNCVVCCPRCNKAKGDMFTYTQFKKLGKVIQTFARS